MAYKFRTAKDLTIIIFSTKANSIVCLYLNKIYLLVVIIRSRFNYFYLLLCILIDDQTI